MRRKSIIDFGEILFVFADARNIRVASFVHLISHLPFTFVFRAVLKLYHGSELSFVFAVVRLLFIIELAEFSTNLGHAVIIIVLVRSTICLAMVVFFIQ